MQRMAYATPTLRLAWRETTASGRADIDNTRIRTRTRAKKTHARTRAGTQV